MKPTTAVWAKFESKGKPESTKVLHSEMRTVVVELGRWMLEVAMGSHIKITMARTETELHTYSSQRTNAAVEAQDDMLAELAAMLEQNTLGLEEQAN